MIGDTNLKLFYIKGNDYFKSLPLLIVPQSYSLYDLSLSVPNVMTQMAGTLSSNLCIINTKNVRIVLN